jgi:YesN/AraC family two-component response regulator
MKLDWDIHELVDFGRRIDNNEQFSKYMEQATKQIAEKLHFADLSYFNFVFKKHVGLSPSGYKNSIFKS